MIYLWEQINWTSRQRKVLASYLMWQRNATSQLYCLAIKICCQHWLYSKTAVVKPYIWNRAPKINKVDICRNTWEPFTAFWAWTRVPWWDLLLCQKRCSWSYSHSWSEVIWVLSSFAHYLSICTFFLMLDKNVNVKSNSRRSRLSSKWNISEVILCRTSMLPACPLCVCV